jgi:hypothetical protein
MARLVNGAHLLSPDSSSAKSYSGAASSAIKNGIRANTLKDISTRA